MARSFAQDSPDAAPDDTTGASPSETEYVFEGFTIDFSEKIALTPPVGVGGNAPTPGQGGANG